MKEGKNRKNAAFVYWLEYIKEKRTVIILYILTAIIFVVIACFYHLENIPKIGYGVVLTAFFWLAAGIYHGGVYVEKRKKIRTAGEYLEHAAEILTKEKTVGGYNGLDIISAERAGSLENAYIAVVEALCEKDRHRQDLWEEKNREQSDYYMMWAHQIKTPISAMKLLLNGQPGSQKENFLLQEYDLYALLKQAIKKYSVLFINSGIKLELQEMQVKIITDNKWFGFCVEQILSNSIKYTAQARRLAGREKREGLISLYMQEGEPSTLVISDNGIGITKEDLPRIFERGFTGYNGRMDKKATGIGLYLCKRILDRLEITIRVESTEGIGTRIYITPVMKKTFAYE